MFFQDSLMKLPVPKLEDSLKKYLDFLEPLVTAEALANTRALVESFRGGEGAKLHEHLVQWDKEHRNTSYISDMWYQMYLKDRSPLPLNLNPQLTWVNDERPGMQAQAARAANIVHAAVRFRATLQAGALAPDVFHVKPRVSKHPLFQHAVAALAPRKLACFPMYAAQAYPLDMSQYARLFASTRVAERGTDRLTSAEGSPRFIAVIRGPRTYRVDVLDENGVPVPPNELEARFRWVLRDSADVPSTAASSYEREPPVAALTGANRDAWADARAALVAGPGAGVNGAALQVLDDALFVLTLDDSKPDSRAEVCHNMLVGDGRSRWFEKCLNVVVCANGRAGVNWEHSWGDGAAVLYWFNTVHETVTKMADRHAGAAAGSSSSSVSGHGVERVQWHLEPATVAAIRAAERETDAAVRGAALRVYETDALTKDDIKRSGLSPDGVMQMALQLAHWRAHGGGPLPVTYESASTAAFKHGRTEVIRSATPQAAAMCEAFAGRDGKGDVGSGRASDAAARFEALRRATERHKAITLDAVQGKGCDRHLYALAVWAERLGAAKGVPADQRLPALFTDPAYLFFKDIRLSTSTLQSPAIDGGGFGPVNDHSLAVGYTTEERGSGFVIMSNRGDRLRANGPYASQVSRPFPAPDNDAFADGVEYALREFYDVIAAVKGKPAAKKVASGGFGDKKSQSSTAGGASWTPFAADAPKAQ